MWITTVFDFVMTDGFDKELFMSEDIRWKERYQNYLKALSQLTSALSEHDETAEALIKEGILQRFEFTHELAWKVMKDYLEYEGYQGITGSRSASRLAFSLGLVDNGQAWMDMIESRNRTVHTYDERVLEKEFAKVQKSYAKAFQQFAHNMQEFV
ncbi:MAG: nucleotidyltransferase substrate binding protein [Pseudomonadota bacterium]|nr:nucleotidyltransferase substrate binding protein [Pseudomonadota bacterium]